MFWKSFGNFNKRSYMNLDISVIILSIVISEKFVCTDSYFMCTCRGAVDLDGRIEPGDMLLQVSTDLVSTQL